MLRSYHLGISCYFHDSAISLVDETGKILFCAQEERFSRSKHDSRIPNLALSQLKREIPDVSQKLSSVSFYENPYKKRNRQLFNLARNFVAKPQLKNDLWSKVIDPKQQLNRLRKSVNQTLHAKVKNIDYFDHHLTHAASAFFPSGMSTALIFVFDGVGEWATTSVYLGKGKSFTKCWSRRFPNSIGLMYSAFTQLCGFKVNTGEYKLMGMAPYGEPTFKKIIMEKIVHVYDNPPFFKLNMGYFEFLFGKKMISKKMFDLFDIEFPFSENDYSQKRLNIAASIQEVTEEIVLRIVKYYTTKYEINDICIAGGVGLNCVANAKLLNTKFVDRVFIQPAAGDAGGALGAALLSAANQEEFTAFAMPVPYLGAKYTQAQCLDALARANIDQFTVCSTEQALTKKIAKLLNEGKIGGVHHSRSEFGPRALGNRSILASAKGQKTQKELNLKIKFRESFRPFAPIVLEDDAKELFEEKWISKFMLLVMKVKSYSNSQGNTLGVGDIFTRLGGIKSDFPAITHVDGSARVQTINEENGLIYKILCEFKKYSGAGVLVNTSFNVRGEPIVETPKDAIKCFLGTNIDFLMLGNILVEKKNIPNSILDLTFRDSFDKD